VTSVPQRLPNQRSKLNISKSGEAIMPRFELATLGHAALDRPGIEGLKRHRDALDLREPRDQL